MIDQIISDASKCSLNIVRKYSDFDGDVLLLRGNSFYMLAVRKKTAPGQEVFRERGRLDALSADELFDVAVRYVRGEIEWAEPIRKFSCKYNPNRSRGCTDANCPRVLGGAAYRELFGKNCPFRTIPRTR